jgi:hypothetical protein
MSSTNIDKPEVEDLLSRYVDGELSEREQTEIKRLAANDEVFAERLVSVKKQKELLENLAVESAPPGIPNIVRGALERKFLLNETVAVADEVAGARNLFARHLMTAAIIFVLFGGLLYMVMQVFSPSVEVPEVATENSTGFEYSASNRKAVVKSLPPRFASKAPVFSSSLDLSGDDVISMNAFVSKAIFDTGLLDETFKNSHDGVTSYYITADISKVRTLVDDLSGVWANCKEKTFTAHGVFPGNDVIVKKVTAAQVAAVFRQDEFLNRIEVARDFSDFNAVVGDLAREKRYASADDESESVEDLSPVKPRLTSGQLKAMGFDDEPEAEKISLTITVKGYE